VLLQVRRRALAEEEERARRMERLQKLQIKWIHVHEAVRAFLSFKAIYDNIAVMRLRDAKQHYAALVITKFFALITFLSRSKKLLQIKRILRRSMWIPLMNIRITRKKKSCHLVARLMDVMHARRYGVYAVMMYRARILKVQRFLQRCVLVYKAQVNIAAASSRMMHAQSHNTGCDERLRCVQLCRRQRARHGHHQAPRKKRQKRRRTENEGELRGWQVQRAQGQAQSGQFDALAGQHSRHNVH
jgi:hypothetical protein